MSTLFNYNISNMYNTGITSIEILVNNAQGVTTRAALAEIDFATESANSSRLEVLQIAEIALTGMADVNLDGISVLLR